MSQKKPPIVESERPRRCRTWLWLLSIMSISTLFVLLVYYVPFVEVEPLVPPPVGKVPMVGALRASNASDFVIQRLYKGLMFGPESIAINSKGNVFMVVHGGIVLQATVSTTAITNDDNAVPKLRKVAQLNDGECTLDAQLFGTLSRQKKSTPEENNNDEYELFENSEIVFSRCSVPLGIRLSRDEQYLYVIDTLRGLYKISLKVVREPAKSRLRLVTKLLDWRKDASRVTHFSNGQPMPYNFPIELKAMDDLVIDEGAGTGGADVIYMTAANAKWTTHEFLYAVLEARYSGYVVRYDTDSGQLSLLDGLTSVRMSPIESNGQLITNNGETIGAPKYDANDVFDTRINSFWNGIELTDNKRALLIADTANRRIIKHYIRGERAGQSDLWTWTPMAPDNIRRGVGERETYWSVGCGHGHYNEPLIATDTMMQWPRMRRFFLKLNHLIGSSLQALGERVFDSVTIANAGILIRTGFGTPRSICPGAIIVQYDDMGIPIRSIHGPDFPDYMHIYSEAQEFVDPRNKSQHIIYLGSPITDYLVRIIQTDID